MKDLFICPNIGHGYHDHENPCDGLIPREFFAVVKTTDGHADEMTFDVKSVREWCEDTYAVSVRWDYRCQGADMTSDEALALAAALTEAANAAKGIVTPESFTPPF